MDTFDRTSIGGKFFFGCRAIRTCPSLGRGGVEAVESARSVHLPPFTAFVAAGQTASETLLQLRTIAAFGLEGRAAERFSDELRYARTRPCETRSPRGRRRLWSRRRRSATAEGGARHTE